MRIVETHIATPQNTPIRIQEYAVDIFKTITTKSALKKAIKKKLILVNELPTSTAKIIVGGEKISLLEADNKITKKQLVLPLKVIYEDDYLAVINKPAGVLVSGNRFKTIENALQQNLQKSSQSDAVCPTPVHRLDFPTTGLLLIGKTRSSVISLSQLFKSKTIKKTYHAITIGTMKSFGIIDFHIDGKEAITTYQVIKTVRSERFSFLNFVKLSPKTGRTHQLRKHLLHLGNPILGDQQHCFEDFVLKGKGLYLHASILEFIHPFTQEKLSIESDIPYKFLKIILDIHPSKTSSCKDN